MTAIPMKQIGPGTAMLRRPPGWHVILFAKGAEDDPSTWPNQNRRRWQLIAKKARQPLNGAETEELSALQQLADEQLAGVGSRPTEQLQQFYAELSKQD